MKSQQRPITCVKFPLNQAYFKALARQNMKLGIRIKQEDKVFIFFAPSLLTGLWLFLMAFPVLARPGGSDIANDGIKTQQDVAYAMNGLWDDVLNPGGSSSSGIYAAICQVGVFFAVGTLLIFITLWARDLIEDGSSLKNWGDMIWPFIVIILLVNNGTVLANTTKELRAIVNGVNQSVLEYTAASTELAQAYQQAQDVIGVESQIQATVSQCQNIAEPAKKNQCLLQAADQVDRIVQEAQKKQRQLPNRVRRLAGKVKRFASNPVGATAQAIGRAFQSALQLAIRGWLLVAGLAFQWGVEVAMLLTGLLGPLAVGGSLLPMGAKPVFGWLTGFFSVGIAKLSFNIMAGLTATIILKAPDSDPMIFAFIVGLFAPFLALLLAAGGGMAILNGLSTILNKGFSIFS